MQNYNPHSFEEQIYQEWEKQDFFNPAIWCKKTFSLVIPPPNVTGYLHIGHALFARILKRMQGYKTLWLNHFLHKL